MPSTTQTEVSPEALDAQIADCRATLGRLERACVGAGVFLSADPSTGQRFDPGPKINNLGLHIERLETEAALHDALSMRATANLEIWRRKAAAVSADAIDVALVSSESAKAEYQQRRGEYWKLRQERDTAAQRITEYVKQARELSATADRARQQAGDLDAERRKLERLTQSAG